MTTSPQTRSLIYSAFFGIFALVACGKNSSGAQTPVSAGLNFDTSLRMGKYCASEKVSKLGMVAERQTCIEIGSPNKDGYPVLVTQQGEQFAVRLKTVAIPDNDFLRLRMVAVADGDTDSKPAPDRDGHVAAIQLRKRGSVSEPGRIVFDGALTHLQKDKFDQWLWRDPKGE